MHVHPANNTPTTGATVIVALGTPVVAIGAPCRIVAVVDEPTRYGFTYVTLPGHVERGEEMFTVSWEPDDEVRFTIVAVSAPASVMTRLAGPLGRAIQSRVTSGYLRALQHFVGQGGE